jgi:ABC-type dipeptide/oligopeptide/nickel transport system ATPase subunit
LKEFESVVDSVNNVNRESNEKSVEKYISTLLKNANESEKKDAYSKSYLFNESEYSIDDAEGLKNVISSVTNLIENIQYREIIDSHIPLDSLKSLAVALMNQYAQIARLNLKKTFINDIVSNIKKSLQSHTAATPIDDVDFHQIAMDEIRIKKFSSLVTSLKIERKLLEKEIQGYTIVALRKEYTGAAQLNNLNRLRLKFSAAYDPYYKNPYLYLKALNDVDGLAASDYYKCFIHIEYQILNRYGAEVSGGERSEFRLLQEINDAHQYDMLLIDEPESSFDNLFLKGKVNELIKEIAKALPVVLVTHNNTVGASIQPHFILYTSKTTDSYSVRYNIFSGYPSDKNLVGLNGEIIQNHKVLLNCLEAGEETYNDRSNGYEILKN